MERDRGKGVLIAVVAVACVTPDAMLLRWARVEGATPWQTAFFKMNIIGFLNLCSALYLTGGPRALMRGVWRDPLALGLASLVQVWQAARGRLAALWHCWYCRLPCRY